MSAEDPRRESDSHTGSSPPRFAGDPSRGNTTAGAGGRTPLWLLTFGAGLVAGLLAWAGGESTLDTFKIADAKVFPANYKKVSGYDKMGLDAAIETATA